jgi:ADP-dependent NAD(P)H-hydrate dehydratase / NAD(P)H-hydrate epimerase
MTELLTAAQMRAIEQAAIASGAVTGLELMERAGRGVVEAIWEEWPELKAAPHRAVVLCGPGNNGGDGFVVARLLKEWGWEVRVLQVGRVDRLPPSAGATHDRWLDVGDLVEGLDRQLRTGSGIGYFDVAVDAMFGTGLSRPLPTPASMACRHRMAKYQIAIDVPSGLCSDSGRPIAEGPEDWVFRADLVVTFQMPKLGHYLSEGPANCTKVVVKDIGLDVSERPISWVYADAERSVFLAEDGRPCIVKATASHKYTHGHALILSGPPGRGGAARLAARGALRIGAGVVTLGCAPEAIPENAARLDAIMLRDVADAGALATMLADPRITALCLGPGLGTGEREVNLLAAALGRVGNLSTRLNVGGQIVDPAASLVLDADALTILSRRPDLFAALNENCVLTPHAGEFARLFPDIAARLDAPATTGPAYSKVDATREAAVRAGCVVLFKGPDTVIADPSGRCAINSAHYDRAAPWLATAGSGDVLAGFITGLLARGVDPMRAAESAAWLHVECALSFGPGLIAEDLPEELPKVFRALGM